MEKLVSKDHIIPYLKNRDNWLWFSLFGTFNTTDWVLTQIAMKSGNFIETNPVWQDPTTLIASVMKLLVLPVVAIMWPSYVHPKVSRQWPMFLTLVFIIICCLNSWTLWTYDG